MLNELQAIQLASKAKHTVDTRPDVGDIRDLHYSPTLAALKPEIDIRNNKWWRNGRVRNQGESPSCTGHALAGLIDHLYARDNWLADPDADVSKKPRFSASMLYHVGRYHDEWHGENYRGSSIRGVLKGFFYNGVCTEKVLHKALRKNGESKSAWLSWHMTQDILKSAQSVQLGGYFRVRARLADLQAALNEVEIVVASADIHPGWLDTKDHIEFYNSSTNKVGRHAFLIVGYNADGLIIQNSWGKKWGEKGLAYWSYNDWAANVLDMWVLRLSAPLKNEQSVRLPQLYTNQRSDTGLHDYLSTPREHASAPKRFDVVGHLIPLLRGKLERHGRYHTNERTLMETAIIVRTGMTPDQQNYRYHHLLFNFMGIQANEESAVTAICKSLPVYKKNGIYPIFIMMENALSHEIHRMCIRVIEEANRLTGTRTTPEKDEIIEGKLSLTALRLVEEIEENSLNTIRTVVPNEKKAGGLELGDGGKLLQMVFEIQNKRYRTGSLSYHIAAHGFGASLVSAMLGGTDNLFKNPPTISSLNLYAPMIRDSTFRTNIAPLLSHTADGRINRRSKDSNLEIERTNLFVMNQSALRGDRPFMGYGCSWPELWAHCFAIAAPESDWKANKIIKAKSNQYDNQRAQMRFLALPSVAKDTCTALGSQHAISLVEISPDNLHSGKNEQALISPKHHDLNMRLPLLDKQLYSILDKKPKTLFNKYYPDRESFVDLS